MLLATLAFPALLWQDDLPPELLQLHSVKQKMAQNLTKIPSYTCLETITRSQRAPSRMVISVPGKPVPFRRMDVVRLEVAEVGGIELFAHPGEHNFEKRELREIVTTGLIGNGIFSGFAHDVFRSSIATHQYFGEEKIDGRSLLRYDFQVPQIFSGYRVGSDTAHAIVGYHGSFWADPETFDAVHMEVISDNVPPETGLTEVVNRVDYARVRIGGSDALLPQHAEMISSAVQGWGSRNDVSFTHCREYGVATVIKFDDPTDSADTGKSTAGTNYVDLPNGLLLTLILDTPIDSATARVGDLLNARVEVDAKHKGSVLVPKDAVISGRLRRLDLHKEGWPYVQAGLEFTLIEFNGKQSRFFAELEKLILPLGIEGPKKVTARDLPGVGMVSATGNTLHLPKGTRMIWKCLSYEQAAVVGK